MIIAVLLVLSQKKKGSEEIDAQGIMLLSKEEKGGHLWIG